MSNLALVFFSYSCYCPARLLAYIPVFSIISLLNRPTFIALCSLLLIFVGFI